MTKRHINIPVFVPHEGCPNDCIFCNQRTITGVSHFNPDDCEKIIEDALSTIDSENSYVEIAFFGGSFTGIEREQMTALLEISDKFIKKGRVHSVRCSTRPDYINDEILDILEAHSVKTIEIGVQSVSDAVLTMCKRGHSAKQTKEACRLITKRSFNLVGQMMVGLPGSTFQSELETAEFICSYGAVAARIYPTVIFTDTELANMQKLGIYKGISLEEAIDRSASLIECFVKNNVNILRVGLCESEGLSKDTVTGGAYHPALGELAFSRYYLKAETEKISELLSKHPDADFIDIYVNTSELSKAVGQHRCNFYLLLKQFENVKFKFIPSADIKKYEIQTDIHKGL